MPPLVLTEGPGLTLALDAVRLVAGFQFCIEMVDELSPRLKESSLFSRRLISDMKSVSFELIERVNQLGWTDSADSVESADQLYMASEVLRTMLIAVMDCPIERRDAIQEEVMALINKYKA